MSLKNSIIEHSAKESPLREASLLCEKGRRSKTALAAPVILTSLVDAFSILVIYLLVSLSHSGEVLNLSKDIKLPQAFHGELLESATVIQIRKGNFYIDDKKIELSKLLPTLVDIRNKISASNSDNNREVDFPLLVQADKQERFAVLDKVVKAASQSGFDEVKFSVIGQ